MKKLVLVFLIFLNGCVSLHSPYPEGYEGPSALVASSENRVDGSTVQIFYLEKVNQKLIVNSMGASRGATQGQGFSFTSQLIETAVPAIEATFTIVGATAHAAPIQSLFSDNLIVRGDITFTPEPHEEYIVKGVLNSEYSAVWIENKETGEIDNKKIEETQVK
ncbi:hypothetical protein [Pseudoalteromonas rhizosphaerae]|uniref:hypothetical protein n=1 Tax=Pseudoalteromonas rhizosphaerae TaxID=2518973 RepID=UPI0021472854|nr:hypothetical protein [Pseudoalteromonas rhizosphaerae]